MLKTVYFPWEWLSTVTPRELLDRLLGVADAVMIRVKSFDEEPHIPAPVDKFLDLCRAAGLGLWLHRWLYPNTAQFTHQDWFDSVYYATSADRLIAECAKRGAGSCFWGEFYGANPLTFWRQNGPPQIDPPAIMHDDLVSLMDAVHPKVDLIGPIGSGSSPWRYNYPLARLGKAHVWAAARYVGAVPAQVPPYHQPLPAMRQLIVTPQGEPVSGKLSTFTPEQAVAITADDDPASTPAFPLGVLIDCSSIVNLLQVLSAWPENFA